MPIYTTPDLNRPKILEEYPATFMDMVGTSFNYAVSENITAMASRAAQRYVSNRVVDIMDRSGKFSQSELFYTPEQANEIGKDYGMEPVKKSISKFEFEINLEQAKRQRVRESRMAAYRGLGATVTRVATGFLASFADPTELLTSLIPVVPLLRKGKLALGLAEGAAEARTMGRAMEGAIEGAFGAAVTEPARYMFANDEQMDYDLTDSLMNVAFGAGLGSALHVGIGKLADFAEKSAKRAEAIRAGEQFATVEDEIARINKANEMASVPERIAAASPETHPNALRAHMAELDSGHRSIAADEVLALDKATQTPYGEPRQDTTPTALEEKLRLFNMSAEELTAYEQTIKQRIRAIEDEVLGPELAKEVRKRDRNGTLDEIESQLTPEQWAVVYGTDPRIPDEHFVRELTKARNNVAIAEGTPEDKAIADIVLELKYSGTKLPENLATASDTELIAYLQFRDALSNIEKHGIDKVKFQNELIRALANRFGDPEDAKFMVEDMFRRARAASGTSRPSAANPEQLQISHDEVSAAAARIAQAERSHPASLTSDPAASTAVSESLSNTSEQVDFENPDSINTDTQSTQRVMEDATARALVDNPDLADALGIVVEGGEDGAKPKLRFPEIENANAELANTQKNVRQALSDVANCLIGF